MPLGRQYGYIDIFTPPEVAVRVRTRFPESTGLPARGPVITLRQSAVPSHPGMGTGAAESLTARPVSLIRNRPDAGPVAPRAGDVAAGVRYMALRRLDGPAIRPRKSRLGAELSGGVEVAGLAAVAPYRSRYAPATGLPRIS